MVEWQVIVAPKIYAPFVAVYAGPGCKSGSHRECRVVDRTTEIDLPCLCTVRRFLVSLSFFFIILLVFRNNTLNNLVLNQRKCKPCTTTLHTCFVPTSDHGLPLL